MGFEYVSKLPTPDEIRAQFPLAPELAAEKARKDAAIRDVFTGDSDKFLVIIGPCSADREDAVIDYVNRLAKVQEKVKDKLILVPRIYTNKPRTTGDGYKGLLHQPNPEGKPNLYQGLIAIRKLHMRVIEETGFSTADEMLYPENLTYLSDGALSVMLNAVHAAQHGHEFIYRSWEVKTQGNPLTHTILRGAVNKHDQCLPNYHYEDLKLLLDLYNERDLKNPACIIDANHSNSNKKYMEQIRIVKEVLHSRRHSDDIRNFVKGVMIESYIEPGSQKVGEHIYGKSITDPCLGWDDSERLLYEIAEGL